MEVARYVSSGWGGARPEDNNYQIDGFDNQESGRHNFGFAAIAIAEFKVRLALLRLNLDAARAMINVVTSGTTGSMVRC